MMLKGDKGFGYVRGLVTPDGLGAWGDGRLFILGHQRLSGDLNTPDVAVSPRATTCLSRWMASAPHYRLQQRAFAVEPQFVSDIVRAAPAPARIRRSAFWRRGLSIHAQLMAHRAAISG